MTEPPMVEKDGSKSIGCSICHRSFQTEDEAAKHENENHCQGKRYRPHCWVRVALLACGRDKHGWYREYQMKCDTCGNEKISRLYQGII